MKISHTNLQSIGVFDSGFGGLNVLRHILSMLPNENITYFGDTAQVPYGDKSEEEMQKLSFANAQFILSKNIKLLVVACHSSCVHSLEMLQKKLSIPVIGISEVGLNLVEATTKNKKVGIVGTSTTIGSLYYQNLFKKREMDVYSVEAPLFVPIIEMGTVEGEKLEKIANIYLGSMLEESIDTLFLACTHYVFIQKVIEKVVGPLVKVVDPSLLCAKEVFRLLHSYHLLSDFSNRPTHQFIVSGDPIKFQKLGENFLQRPISHVEKSNMTKNCFQ